MPAQFLFIAIFGGLVKKYLATVSFAVLVLLGPAPSPTSLNFGSFPAHAQSVLTLENLSFKGELATVRIPSITIEGSTATKSEIEALFDPKTLSTLGARLTKISARSVSIPLIEMVQTQAELVSTTTYKDIVFRNVANGVIAEIVSPLMTVTAKAKPVASTAAKSKTAVDFPGFEMEMTNVVMKGTDLPLFLRFVYDKAQPGETLKVGMAEQTVGKTTYKVGDLANFTFASITAKDFKVKPLSKPLLETIAILEKQNKEKTKDGDKLAFTMIGELLTAFSFGNMDVNGIVGEVKQPGEKTAVKVSMDRMSMAGGVDVPGRFTMQGFKTTTPTGNVNMGEISVEGISLASMLAAIQKISASPDAKMDDFDPMVFVPKIDVVRIAGIDIDMPDEKNKNQRIKAKLGLFETKMSNHVGAIPANVTMAMDKFQMDLPANSKEKGIQDIIALGYKSVDVSARYDQSWDQTSKVLKLNEISMRSAGMFATSIKAELGNVAKEVFTTNKAIAAVAALAVNAKSVDVSVTNESLFEKLIAQQATQQKRKVEDVRAELAAGATLMIPMFMGDHPGAKVLGAAVGQFLAEPKNLKVNLTAKGGGLGAADYIAVSNPMELLKKVDITATANK
jgi:hypothetical protein